MSDQDKIKIWEILSSLSEENQVSFAEMLEKTLGRKSRQIKPDVLCDELLNTLWELLPNKDEEI